MNFLFNREKPTVIVYNLAFLETISTSSYSFSGKNAFVFIQEVNQNQTNVIFEQFLQLLNKFSGECNHPIKPLKFSHKLILPQILTTYYQFLSESQAKIYQYFVQMNSGLGPTVLAISPKDVLELYECIYAQVIRVYALKNILRPGKKKIEEEIAFGLGVISTNIEKGKKILKQHQEDIENVKQQSEKRELTFSESEKEYIDLAAPPRLEDANWIEKRLIAECYTLYGYGVYHLKRHLRSCCQSLSNMARYKGLLGSALKYSFYLLQNIITEQCDCDLWHLRKTQMVYLTRLLIHLQKHEIDNKIFRQVIRLAFDIDEHPTYRLSLGSCVSFYVDLLELLKCKLKQKHSQQQRRGSQLKVQHY